jgi:cytochrome c-type biogenesis protein CcmH/NrfF
VVNAHLKMLGLAAISAALLFGASAATAADGEAAAEPEGWAYKISHDLMSPFCPGRTLSACPSPKADELRRWLIDQEDSGRSREDVEAELFEIWGNVLRSAPLAEGFGMAAYVFPVIAFLAGGVVVGVFLRRQTRAVADPAPSAPASDPELERAIDRELED